MTTGEKRRYELSLTVEERRETEIRLLKEGLAKDVLVFDSEIEVICESLEKRGLFRKVLGGAYRTTERGKSALGREVLVKNYPDTALMRIGKALGFKKQDESLRFGIDIGDEEK